MNVQILKEDKDDLEVGIDDVTIAEILRVYLNDLGVEFVAWRREHPSKPAILKIKTSGKAAKKAVLEAIESVKSDCEKFVSAIKKK